VFRFTANSNRNSVPPALWRAAIPAGALLGLLLAATPARAQLNSNVATVNLVAILATSLRVTAAPGRVNFALVPNGIANGSARITVTTRWTLQPGTRAVTTYAYFSSAAAGLTDGAGDNIPASKVAGSVNGGAFGPFTGASPFGAGSSMRLFNRRIRRNNRTGRHRDRLNLRIDTTGLNLPAGTYTGVLNIQAQAI
jgi:hypothetical protein